MTKRPTVALVIETSSIYGRRLLAGVTRYLHTQTRWSVALEQRSLMSLPPDWLIDWKGDGVLSRATTPALASMIHGAGDRLPWIDLTDRHGDLGFVHLWSDDRAVGELAAEHFSERGFINLAFSGFTGEVWSEVRRDGFIASLSEMDLEATVFESAWQPLGESGWNDDQVLLRNWIADLPKPVAIFACNDIRGHQILNACQHLEIPSPEEVAVLGVDDDALVCRLCRPTLSSIVPNPEAIGYRGAELLDHWIKGSPPQAKIERIAPIGIEVRQSSDIIAVEDAIASKALQIIREYACDGLSVSDLLDRLSISRSALERRFRKATHRSPQSEIRLVQLKRVKQLLVDSDFALPRIAEIAGFEHPEYLNVLFKRLTGITPGEFRKSAKSPTM